MTENSVYLSPTVHYAHTADQKNQMSKQSLQSQSDTIPLQLISINAHRCALITFIFIYTGLAATISTLWRHLQQQHVRFKQQALASGFRGLWGSVLPLSTQVRGFKPG